MEQQAYNNKRPKQYSSKQKKVQKPLVDFWAIARYFALWIVLALVAYGIKFVVMMAFEASPTKQVGNGILTLYEVHNTGAAFNLFSNQSEMIITASFFAIAILTFIVFVASNKLTQTAISAMAALSAGITMNMLERINYGYVIDYIHCDFMPDFPVFNVPDIMIVVGAFGLMLAILTKK
jgi:signal peptidase II